MSTIKWHHWNDHRIAQTTEEMQIAGFTVPKGYLNASQMCRVKDETWSKYLRSKGTRTFLKTLATDVGISLKELTITIRRTSAASNWDIWVHPELAFHLAEWLGLKHWAWATLAEAVISMPLPLMVSMVPRTYFDTIKALVTLESDLEKTKDILAATKDCLMDCLLEKQALLEAHQLLIDDYYRNNRVDYPICLEDEFEAA